MSAALLDLILLSEWETDRETDRRTNILKQILDAPEGRIHVFLGKEKGL